MPARYAGQLLELTGETIRMGVQHYVQEVASQTILPGEAQPRGMDVKDQPLFRPGTISGVQAVIDWPDILRVVRRGPAEGWRRNGAEK